MKEKTSFNRRSFLKYAGAFGLLAGATGDVMAVDTRRGRDRNELLVGVAPSAAGVRATAERALPAEARVVRENRRLGYATVELPARASASANAAVAERIANEDGIEYVEPNAVFEALFVPDDARFDEQYAPQMVHAPAAWEQGLGERDVTVAVVDTGVKYDHPDLAGSVGSDVGWDAADDDDDPYPDVLADETHGTHVAGLATGRTDNDTGIAGISNATLLCVRALNESETGYVSDIADGIQWATDHGADVINLSLGGGGYTETLQKAVAYAHAKGVVLVAAAGNDYGGPVLYPAAYDECIAVSALDPDGSLAPYSNVGPEVELCAPGTSLLSTWTDDGYANLSGTSMATPVVSGVAALVLSRWELTNDEVRTKLQDTAVDVGLPSDQQGAGRVDAAAAVGGPLIQTLTVEGTGPQADYRLTVGGNLEKSTANGASINDSDDISGNAAEGYVKGGTDSYTFDGDLFALALDGDATVSLEGRQIDPDDYPDHVLTVVGAGPRADYSFVVGENLQKSTANGASIGGSDDVSGNSVVGWVGGGADSYTFDGDLFALDLDGDARIELDGRRLDSDNYPDHVLTVEGTGPRADYSATVGGNLEKSTANGASIGGSDEISGNSVVGWVGGGADSYTFDGDLFALDLDGDARIELDGRRIASGDYPDRVFTIEGTGSHTDYTLTADGNLQKSRANGASIGGSDDISGNTVDGWVGGGADSYTFDGSIVDLILDGDARIELDRRDRTITVIGDGPRVEYEFVVDGSVTPLDVNDHDTVRADGASGRVYGGTDRYRYSGALRLLTVGGVSVAID